MMTRDSTTLWLVIAAAGLGTFLIRSSFIAVLGRWGVPRWLERFLRHVPAAVLAALVAPALFVVAGVPAVATSNPRLWAGLAAALVAWRTGNALGTMTVGMGALWLLQWALS